MKPLNQSERNGAFWQFLLLFIITIATVATAIFFSIQVPLSDNKQLRQQMADLQNEKDLYDSINTALRAATNELKTFDPKKENPFATKRRVLQRIDRLNELVKVLPNNGENSV